ncbi:unnamed protein product, partial [Ixodes hexagonus]
ADTTDSPAVQPKSEPWNPASMADQEDHQLLGFDDSPVVIPEPKKVAPEVNGSAVQVTKAELILNTLNSEKSLQNGKREEAPPVSAKDTNGCAKVEDVPVDDQTNNQHAAAQAHTRDGEPLYSEVPEDNIYEEVIPVHERKVNGTVEKVQEAVPKEVEAVSSPLYDDSSLSSELSTELSPPASNVGDGAGSNGTTMSDPECDAIMTVGSAPESQLHGMDVPFVVIEESTPVDSDQSNDEVADPPVAQSPVRANAEPVEEAPVEPTILPIVKSAPEIEAQPSESPSEAAAPETPCPDVEEAVEETSSQPVICAVTEFTKVEAVQFVESESVSGSASLIEGKCSVKEATAACAVPCGGERLVEESVEIGAAVHVDVSADGESVKVEADTGDSPFEGQVASEPLYATPTTAQSAAPPVVLNDTPASLPRPPPQLTETRQLKQSAEDSIVAREIRAQKEREETIARERKLALEAAKLSPVVERPADKPTPQVDASPAAKPVRPALSAVSPAASPQSATVPAPFPAPIEKRFSCPSDSKIADEIRELQEREEELRVLRERLLLQNEATPPKPSSDEGERGHSVSSSSPNGISRTVSVESLPSGQSGFSFGSRRKDKITVRPLSDGLDETPSPTSFSSNGESPIEREIRLTRDREEALRREKGLLGQLQAEGFVKKGDTVLPSSICKNVKTGSVPRGPAPLGSTQKILATSRIQQEIEEQTQREMALRESGHIQTISQERTDSRVTRIGNDGTVSPTASAVSTTTSKRNSFDASLPNVEIYDKTPSPTNNKQSPSSPPIATTAVKATNGHGPKATNGTSRGVSMQKFLASRGKELVFTTPPQNGNFAEKSAGFEYRELKPPQLHKGVVPGDALRKGLVTAETKIQEEMRVMKEREEELRRQRIRLLGQSQPNLSLLECSTDSVDSYQLQRVGSNPNLLESPQPSGAPRRRSALIAQWEQRIQSTDVAKS